MNKDTLQLIGQVILIGLGPLLAKRGITIGSEDVDHVLGVGAFIAGIIWKFRHWNSTPDSSGGTPTTIPIKQVATIFVLTAVIGSMFTACAPLQPGADPLVVRVEQTETIAQDTFDQVLEIDNSQRSFYASNAPAFHQFCEWLRAPQRLGTNDTATLGTNAIPRASAVLLTLDDLKLAYKQGQASSNELVTALQVVTTAINQAQNWLDTGMNGTNSITLKP